MTCPDCGATLRVGDYPFCHGDPARHGRGGLIAVPDDIPGGEVVQHCPGLHGQRFYSKRAIREAAARLGWENRVYWTGEHERHVQRMSSVDLTDYDDPAVIRARQQALAEHCGMTLDAYLALVAQPVESRHASVGGDDALNRHIAEQIARFEGAA